MTRENNLQSHTSRSAREPAPTHPVFERYQRVQRPRAAAEVFDTLTAMILSGELEPGSSLPPEKDLAAHFGVSRLIVRQAIHRLADLDLARPRQGGATTVSDPAECDNPEVSVLALRFGPERDEQFKALRERQIVGSLGLLVLAMRRATRSDVSALRSIVATFRAEPERLDELNEAFWIRVADITRNAFFQREARYWFRVSRENPRVEQRTTLSTEARLASYEGILDQLERGLHDGEKASAVDAYLSVVDSLLDLIDDGTPSAAPQEGER